VADEFVFGAVRLENAARRFAPKIQYAKLLVAISG